jgi:hypothetical protein
MTTPKLTSVDLGARAFHPKIVASCFVATMTISGPDDIPIMDDDLDFEPFLELLDDGEDLPGIPNINKV